MSAFVDTSLIECNRLQSIEHLSDNTVDRKNSEWSNRLGEALQLNVGDRVSVSSAYINARGCGGQNIETKGKFIGTKTFTKTTATTLETDTTNNLMPGHVKTRIVENQDIPIKLYDNQITIPMKTYKTSNGENYCFLPRKFYGIDTAVINASGGAAAAAEIWTAEDNPAEGAAFYQGPIRWDWNGGLPTDAGYDVQLYPSRGPITNLCYTQKAADDYLEYTQSNLITGLAIPASKEGEYAGWPIELVNMPGIGTQPTPKNYRYTEFTQYYTYLRPKNGNERFTLFKQSHFYSQYSGAGAINWNALTAIWLAKSDRGFDPCTVDFIENIDLLPIIVPTGFHSPQALSDEITQQLQRSTGNQPTLSVNNDGSADWKLPVDGEGTNHVFTPPTAYSKSITYATNTWKPIACSGVNDINASNYGFMKNNASRDSQEALNWFNGMTENIYVKRPEIWKAGRKLNDAWAVATDGTFDEINNLERIHYDYTKEGNNTQSFTTGLHYTKDNLDKLKNLFEAQSYYPELWDEALGSDNQLTFNLVDSTSPTYNTKTRTPDNSRYLHMNTFPTDATHFKNFGDDGYEPYSYWNKDGGLDWWKFAASGMSRQNEPTNYSHATSPMFFYFDKSASQTYIENPSIPNLTDDVAEWKGKLSYGFASKKTYDIGGVLTDFIELHPQILGGMNKYLFKYGTGQVATATTGDARDGFLYGNLATTSHKIGYDWHFCAFGTLCMNGFSGYTKQSYGGYFAPGIRNAVISYPNFYTEGDPQAANREKYNAGDLSAMYVGAKNAALKYNPTSQRFYWEYLHTPEQIGNEWDAGSTKTDSSEGANPILSDANEEVYKLNKRLKLDNFCPNVRPYQVPKDYFIGVVATSLSTRLTVQNPSIERWKVFDAHGGVFFDLGKCFDKENWEEGLLSILGFTYGQYNEPITKLTNTQAVINFTNNNKLSSATTNSQIVSTDTSNFVVNPYGAVMYNNQVPSSVMLAYKSASGSATQVSPIEWVPAISEQTQSILLSANNLPRTMLRPYYCIRSSLVGQSKFIGGSQSGLKYPIVSVANKINAEKDFIQMQGGDITFTMTAPVRISDITTRITDPNGELAELDEGSSVIYRIEKDKNTAQFNIIDQILQKEKKK